MAGAIAYSQARIVQQLMIDSAQGSDPMHLPIKPWPCYASNEPPDQDEIEIVYDTAGQEDGRDMITGQTFVHHGVQVLFRGPDHDKMWMQANAVKNWMMRGVRMATATIKNGSAAYNPALGAHSFLIWCFSKIRLIDVKGTQSPNTKRSVCSLNALVAIQQLT